MGGMWRRGGDEMRVLRRRLQLTQADLGAQAGVSAATVRRVERGSWDAVPVGALTRMAGALGARVRFDISWRGEGLDRLVDAGHAELQDRTASLLRDGGWQVAPEVSFNHYGDRGRCDLLARHATTGIMLVVEVKTAIGDLQDLVGRLDVKVRLGGHLAATRGWPPPARVIPMLVLGEERQQYRIVGSHPSLFATFELRGRSARAWVRRPRPTTGLLVRFRLTKARLVTIRAASRGQRVRKRLVDPTSAEPETDMSLARGDSPP